jgi:hypothetical protein
MLLIAKTLPLAVGKGIGMLGCGLSSSPSLGDSIGGAVSSPLFLAVADRANHG